MSALCLCVRANPRNARCGLYGSRERDTAVGKLVSIAVAVRKGRKTVIAADTQSNFGDRRATVDNHRAGKIRRVGASYVATSGWGIYDDVLRDHLTRARRPNLKTETDVFSFFMKLWKELHERYSLVNDQAHEDDRSPFGDLDASFLIAGKESILHVSGNMSVSRFQKYYAIGSGADFAIGAMHVLYDRLGDAEAIAQEACATAIAFDVFCGGEIDVFTV
jgi:ATP-dependent HslUV protease, peptidase subunit HslV